ncbi:MAG: Mfa1 family fimbria major subunit [Clostridia bacterium]|nr:Mfa1 family fimbria major subunit [Clostridia bacterium]
MKKAFLILGIAAAAIAVSCNKDELNNKEVKVFEGDKAYVVVNINGVSTTQTRADDNFLYGDSDENAVKDAYFYFYDSEGGFVTEAAIFSLSSNNDQTGTGIAYAANTVITLSGLTQKEYPNWVVAVINKPTRFTAPKTLDEFAAALADASSALYQTGNTNFTMTTSSYVATADSEGKAANQYTSESNTYYFATPVTNKNFVPEDIGYDTDNTPKIPDGYEAVKIYVERLAAKVTVMVSSTLSNTATSDLYAITQEVFEDTGETPTSESLYIKLNGWKLNATAKSSYYMKEIDDKWTPDGLGFTWNVTEYYRSYWAKAWPYGIGFTEDDFPQTSNGSTDGTSLNDYLNYTSLSGTPNSLGSYGDSITYGDIEYCAENTNTAEVEGIPSALTSILLSATVCDETGTGKDIVRHNGYIYTLNAYYNLVLTHLTGYYTDSSASNALAASDLELATGHDGLVTVALKSGVTVYDTNGTDATSDAEAALKTFNEDIGNDANYFNGGAMYYNIPIRHLSTIEPTTGNDDDSVVYNEGYYGVVRNHWYLGIIKSLTSLGKGIAKTDEVIVPTPEDATYYIGADVSILEWAYVDWEIEL